MFYMRIMFFNIWKGKTPISADHHCTDTERQLTAMECKVNIDMSL